MNTRPTKIGITRCVTSPIHRTVPGNALRLPLVGEKRKKMNHVAQITPLIDFFDSSDFNKLDVTQKQRQLKSEITERENNKPLPTKPDPIHYDFDVDWFSGFCFKFPPPISLKHGSHQAMRRPLAISFGAYQTDIDDWSDKPFSTLDLDYKQAFPLLLQRVTEPEEKDLVYVKTETRRYSVVTTDYMTGKISLLNRNGKETNFNVFPVFHEVVEFSSTDLDEYPSYHQPNLSTTYIITEEHTTCEEDAGKNVDGGDVQMQPKSADVAKSSSESSLDQEPTPDGWPPGWNPKARRQSIAGAPRLQASSGPRIVRRQSIDYGGAPFTYRPPPVMEKLVEEVCATDEDDRLVEESKKIQTGCLEFDIKHAEEAMQHLDHNLETLEKFLDDYNSTSMSSFSNDSIQTMSDSSSDEDDDVFT